MGDGGRLSNMRGVGRETKGDQPGVEATRGVGREIERGQRGRWREVREGDGERWRECNLQFEHDAHKSSAVGGRQGTALVENGLKLWRRDLIKVKLYEPIPERSRQHLRTNALLSGT